MKKISFYILALVPIFILLLILNTGCSSPKTTDAPSTTTVTPASGYDAEDYDKDYSDENPQTITLKGDSIDFSGDGATLNGTTLTINKAGAYILSGTLNDGSIVVDGDKTANVRLVLNDANITSSTGAAIYSKQSQKTLITLEAGTNNSLTDSTSRDTSDPEAPTAALYVQDNLTINGDGALSVTGNYNDAITSKDDLKIISGNITVPASADDGIVGRDATKIAGGTIKISATGDGIKATNDEDTSKGSIQIDGGTFNITTGDDGLHADNTLTINNGNITIAKSYEGLEGMVITLNGGNGNITASDDGMNAAGGDGSSQNGRPGQNPMDASAVDDGSVMLNINGGTWYVNAGGDGLDSNASINQTGGNVTVNGPSDSGNSALDYDGTYNLTGGSLVAAGSAGMLQTPSEGTSQNTIVLIFTSTQSAGTAIGLSTLEGSEITNFTPAKNFQSIIICTPDIKTGTSYNFNKNGINLVTVTPSSTITSINEDGSTSNSSGIGGPSGGVGGGPK